ncbi:MULTISPECIES: hypothetical protein [unclassified Janthinobacterium]|uniref:hypothetical protein n=1 Tax=unclassified Janthinobacterium TaxID=2610881 RepID=UPI0008F4B0D5|nr:MULTISPECIES: hypothetical protein [unclassified Janthinobacterium]APA68743.1 hypothetical protein YQ44_14085 [Janthinobacterium sp. 1_2014MBL_MicDiv]MDN2710563.1 hypothetical protein [Janthinobacterium sp. SUN118]
MAFTTPQRTITISIIGNDQNAQVRYSYWSPITGLTYQQSPICDLTSKQATYCLFLLDYESTRNGWTIVNTSPNGTSPVLAQVAGAYNLSVMTINPYTTLDTYNFYINYRNALTGIEVSFDPQEGNIPPGRPEM